MHSVFHHTAFEAKAASGSDIPRDGVHSAPPFDLNQTQAVPYPPGAPPNRVTFGGMRRDWQAIRHIAGGIAAIVLLVAGLALWKPAARSVPLARATMDASSKRVLRRAAPLTLSLEAAEPSGYSPYAPPHAAPAFPAADTSQYQVWPAAPLPAPASSFLRQN